MAQRHPDGVEMARCVEPVRRAHDALFAERELLAAHSQAERFLLRIANLDVSQPKIHGVLKGRDWRVLILPEDVCVLALYKKLEPRRRLNAHVNTETGEQIAVGG